MNRAPFEISLPSRFLAELEDREIASKLTSLTADRQKWLTWKPFAEVRELWHILPELKGEFREVDGWVEIGETLDPGHADRLAIQKVAESIRPWKKGPFRIFGMEIDAEWRSDHKWDRMVTALPDLKGKRLLDVGCHNGYYMFRMLAQRPEYVLGIDPVPRLWYQFHFLNHFLAEDALEFRMWGWQEMEGWTSQFDGIFCMGILYHHPDPIGLLRTLFAALRPGGFLVLESIVIPGEDHRCLIPSDRYAKMRNVWFLPTVRAMEIMLERTRFRDVICLADQVHTPREQRTTYWNQGPSHADFMMPGDPSKTCEGYPAPRRAILLARKA